MRIRNYKLWKTSIYIGNASCSKNYIRTRDLVLSYTKLSMDNCTQALGAILIKFDELRAEVAVVHRKIDKQGGHVRKTDLLNKELEAEIKGIRTKPGCVREEAQAQVSETNLGKGESHAAIDEVHSQARKAENLDNM